MNHTEQRLWLIKELQKDSYEFANYKVPSDAQGQKDLLRALMNTWTPSELDEEFLKIQDEYLTEENRLSQIISPDDLQTVDGDRRIYLWQGDITCLKCGAIVNAANSQMLGCFRPLHNCIDNIIHSKAGLSLRFKCNCIMRAQGHEEPTGKAKITPAYNLTCKYVIHTVGPIVQGSLTKRHEDLLASCYRSCLDIAEENNVESIALCCISTGVFMFPNQRAAEIAVDTVKAWLAETGSQMKVVFNVYKDLDLEIYSELLQ